MKKDHSKNNDYSNENVRKRKSTGNETASTNDDPTRSKQAI
jgi:hypothetical protein